jgi:hypothetical protein
MQKMGHIVGNALLGNNTELKSNDHNHLGKVVVKIWKKNE